jgi:hypothetical protein
MRKLSALPALAAAWSLAVAAALAPLAPAARAQDATAPSPGASAAVSQEDAAAFGEAAAPITALRGIKNKTLVLVFDVSGSMKAEGNLRRARAAAINILREGAASGDRVALFTFGAGNQKVFDTTLASRADLPALIQQVPAATGEGAGTNIRRPHHEALKILDSRLPRPGVIVLLTDSFNDEPKSEDPAYPDYLKYYTPGGRLTRYPNTPENRDYERLLAKLMRSGKLTQFGIGVQVGPDGRPVERLPQAAPPPVAAPDPTPQPYTSIPSARADNSGSLIWLWLAIGAGVLALAYAAFRQLGTTTALRITGGPAGAKDFAIKNGQSVRLGGEGASVAFDAYALPAAAKEPVAHIKGARGQLVLSPAVPTKVTAGGNPDGGPRVFHNGLALERDAPLNYGDEVRVSVPAGAGAAPKEYRLRFEDPRKSF